jgi:uncharacterized membrane protein YphA (DoxX/SURF4 family)
MNKGFDSRLDQGWWVLRIGLGVGPLLAGLDKYFNLLANWTGYMSPLALKILPFSGQTFMHIVGVIEMIVGLAILTKWTRMGAYVASAWLVAIAINLVSTGMFFDIAVRDVEMALAAFVLARMTEVRSDALHGEAPNERTAKSDCRCLMRVLAHQEFLITAKRSIISNGTFWIVRRDANHT